jgi:hypothetical protein
MFEFELDNSNYFDFFTKNKKDVVIRQDAQLPLLEIYPIPTENFSQLLSYIDNMVVTFSMYDDKNCFIIKDKAGIINTNTKVNNINDDIDTCREIIDFTIQYHFTKKDTKNIGKYKGEFKIIFEKYGEQKTIIVPLNYKLDIEVLPSFTKTTT